MFYVLFICEGEDNAGIETEDGIVGEEYGSVVEEI